MVLRQRDRRSIYLVYFFYNMHFMFFYGSEYTGVVKVACYIAKHSCIRKGVVLYYFRGRSSIDVGHSLSSGW